MKVDFWIQGPAMKVDFWIQGLVAADTLHSGTIFDQSDTRRYPVSWILIGRKSFHCAMWTFVSKNQLSTDQNLFNARAISWNNHWTCIIPLDMYRLGSYEIYMMHQSFITILREMFFFLLLLFNIPSRLFIHPEPRSGCWILPLFKFGLYGIYRSM